MATRRKDLDGIADMLGKVKNPLKSYEEKEYHTSGLPENITSEWKGPLGKGTLNTDYIDEGEFSEIRTQIPLKPFVVAQSDSDLYTKGEKFFLEENEEENEEKNK